VAQVKAVACELPSELGVPISRFSRAELHRLVIERGVTDASAATIARWLAEDAIKPWQHRAWVFPRDPRFLERAGPVLDLYERRWEGRLLHPGEYVVCAVELLSFRISAAGGLTLPAGRLGCNGFVSGQTTIRKLGSCSLAREPMHSPGRLTLGPRGTLYVGGLLDGDGRGIGLYRLGATGVPSPARGVGGCLLDGHAVPERALCNRVFAEGSLRGVDETLVVSPDGHWAYEVDQPRDAPRLVVLRRVP
jgi:hypothetical protein